MHYPVSRSSWAKQLYQNAVLMPYFVCWVSLNIGAIELRPSQPWPGPKSEYIFLEGEDFKIGKGWTIKDTIQGYRVAHTDSGLKHISGAEKGDEDCSKEIVVPANGDYKLWVSFCQNLSDEDALRGPFSIIIIQDGKEQINKTFDKSSTGSQRKATDDRRQIVRQAREEKYPPFRWESISGSLKTGPATVIIRKAGKEVVDRRCRSIDCLLLTRDAEYTPDYRDFGPQTYMRTDILKSTPEKFYLLVYFHHMRTPLRERFTISRAGVKDSYNQPANEFFSAGDSTGWINISRNLYNDCDTVVKVLGCMSYEQKEFTESSNLKVDFATAPREDAIVSSFARDGKGAGLAVRVPPDLIQNKPKSDLQYAQERQKALDELPRLTFGRVPQKFPVVTNFDISDFELTPGTRETEIASLKELGLNGFRGELQPQDKNAGIKFSIARANVSSLGDTHYLSVPADGWKAELQKKAAALKADPASYVAAMVTDEATPEPLELMKKHPATQQAFVIWLQKQNKKPEDLGISDWSNAEFTTDRDTKTPALYVESQKFRASSIAQSFRTVTENARPHFPPNARTMQNFSDGAVYCANFYAQGNDYFTWFRDLDALDLAYTEDWTNNGSTGQLCGWNAALFRSATQLHKQPLGMLVVAYHKRLPRDIKLKTYSSIAEGAKLLHFFCYTLPYDSHEQGEYFKPDVSAAIKELTHEIGAAEDVLLDAQNVPARTAIIYSRISDIWEVNHDSVDGHERMHTYLALRHAQKSVDVVDEDQVIGNALNGKETAYLFGEQLDRRAVPAIVDFVKKGGTLVVSPGAGQRDELNRPTDRLDKSLGIQREALKRDQLYWGPSLYLANLKTLGELELPGKKSVPYFAVRQDLKPQSDDTINARFKNGAPASVTHKLEKGQVIVNGFLPAVSYICTALSKGPNPKPKKADPNNATDDAVEATKRSEITSFPLAADFSSELRNFVCNPVKTAEQVEVDTPIVEATFMEGKSGWVVPLANYTGSALKEITITIHPGEKNFNEVRSSRLGALIFEAVPGQKSIRIKMPLDSTDMIFAEWAK